MRDSCKHCELRGNYNKCINTECYLHESWHAHETQIQMDKLISTLKEMQEFNNLKNDLDSYLYELVEWGLGNREKHPDIDDYK